MKFSKLAWFVSALLWLGTAQSAGLTYSSKKAVTTLRKPTDTLVVSNPNANAKLLNITRLAKDFTLSMDPGSQCIDGQIPALASCSLQITADAALIEGRQSVADFITINGKNITVKFNAPAISGLTMDISQGHNAVDWRSYLSSEALADINSSGLMNAGVSGAFACGWIVGYNDEGQYFVQDYVNGTANDCHVISSASPGAYTMQVISGSFHYYAVPLTLVP